MGVSEWARRTPVTLGRDSTRWPAARAIVGLGLAACMTVVMSPEAMAQSDARKHEWAVLAGLAPGDSYGAVTGSTGIVQGTLRFGVDLGHSGRISLPIEASPRWRIEYDGPGSPVTPTPWVENRNDGRVRTVTFTIPMPQFRNRQEHGMDFRIACDGPEDVIVRWVRVVRPNPPL